MAGMGDPVTLLESTTPSVATPVPTVIAGEMEGEKSLYSGAPDRGREGHGRVEVILWAWPFGCLVEKGSSEDFDVFFFPERRTATRQIINLFLKAN